MYIQNCLCVIYEVTKNLTFHSANLVTAVMYFMFLTALSTLADSVCVSMSSLFSACSLCKFIVHNHYEVIRNLTIHLANMIIAVTYSYNVMKTFHIHFKFMA